MAEMERLQDALTTPPRPEYWDQRASEGWRLVGVQWERAAAGDDGEGVRRREEVPYGMRVADDCAHLEEKPDEMEVLARMLRLIADDLPLSQVARELNQAGFRTRAGAPWTQVSTFNLLPRLTEMAPRVFAAALLGRREAAAKRP